MFRQGFTVAAILPSLNILITPPLWETTIPSAFVTEVMAATDE